MKSASAHDHAKQSTTKLTRVDDRALGMDQPIARRDFLDGVALAAGSIISGMLPGLTTEGLEKEPAAQARGNYYPPRLTGLRGSHPGSFEVAHRLRDGDLLLKAPGAAEIYDLMIVGGGISGLSAAYFYRERRPEARILILDNHDDFGGHAKRNEFELRGRIELINGGTLEIDSPRPYGIVAARLLRKLGVDPVRLDAACTKKDSTARSGLAVASSSIMRPSASTSWSLVSIRSRWPSCWPTHRSRKRYVRTSRDFTKPMSTTCPVSPRRRRSSALLG